MPISANFKVLNIYISAKENISYKNISRGFNLSGSPSNTLT